MSEGVAVSQSKDINTAFPVFEQQWQAIAFATALVQRMAPNYQLFSDITGFGDGRVFGNIVNLVWESVSGKNQKMDFEKQQAKLELITPDPADFDMYGVWPALDAAVALASLLSCCERWDKNELQSILELSLATIHGYIEAVAEKGGEEDVEARRLQQPERHPLELAEAECIAELCAMIEDQSGGRVALVKQLRSYLDQQAVSNIGLSTSNED